MRESGTWRNCSCAVCADRCLCRPSVWPMYLLGPGEPPEALRRRGSAGRAQHPAGPLPGRRGVRPQAGPAVSHRAAPGEAGRGVSEVPFSVRITQPNDGVPVRNPPEPPWPQWCTERSLSTACAGSHFLLNMHVSCGLVLENANSQHASHTEMWSLKSVWLDQRPTLLFVHWNLYRWYCQRSRSTNPMYNLLLPAS